MGWLPLEGTTPSLYPAVPLGAPTTPSQAPPFSVTNAHLAPSRVPVLAVVAGVAAIVGVVVIVGIYLGLRAAPATQLGAAASATTAGTATAGLSAATSAGGPRTTADDPTGVRIGSLATSKPPRVA